MGSSQSPHGLEGSEKRERTRCIVPQQAKPQQQKLTEVAVRPSALVCFVPVATEHNTQTQTEQLHEEENRPPIILPEEAERVTRTSPRMWAGEVMNRGTHAETATRSGELDRKCRSRRGLIYRDLRITWGPIGSKDRMHVMQQNGRPRQVCPVGETCTGRTVTLRPGTRRLVRFKGT
jgi:hypothetical protein